MVKEEEGGAGGCNCLSREEKGNGFEKHGMQRRMNGCMRKKTHRCKAQIKVEQEVRRGKVLTDEGGAEGGC